MTLQPALGYFDLGHDLTDRAFYDSALAPLGHATTLPGLAYRSKAFAELENEKIWTRSWVCMGHHDRIPAPGDILPFTVGNHGVHLYRDADLAVSGRFNFAQHGGCRFVPRQCQTGKKTSCSFTSCGYSRDRDVMLAEPGGIETPEMYMYLGNNPDKLIPVGTATLGTLAFVNLDLDRVDLEQQVGAFAAPLRHYLSAGTHRIGRFQRTGAFNWKLFPRSALASAPGHAAQAAPTTGVFWGLSLDPDGNRPRPLALTRGALPAFGPDVGSHVVWLHPNLLLQLRPESMTTVVVQPIGLTETLLHVDVFRVGDAHATGTGNEPERAMQSAGTDIDEWAAMAEQAQRDIAGNDNPSPFLPQRDSIDPGPVEPNALYLDWQRHLVEQVLTRHEYVSRPLYTNPGRSLNAGVNAGAG